MSNYSSKQLLERIEETVTQMGFKVHNKNGKVIITFITCSKTASGLSIG